MILESKAAAQHHAGQISGFPQQLDYLSQVQTNKKMYQNKVRAFFAAVFFSLLTACGGGGGEDSAAFDDTTLRSGYTGNTNPAVLTQINAKELSATVFLAQEMGGAFTRSLTAKPNRRTDLVSLALQLASYANKFPASNTADQNYTRSITRAIIDEREECGSGYAQYSGDINDNTGSGSVTSTFNNCIDAGEELNGKLIFDMVSDADMTITMEDFSLSSTDYKISMNGSLRVEDFYESTRMTRLTMNMLIHEHFTDEQIKTENLVISSTNANGDAHISVSGRVYESKHGYFDIHTASPFVLDYYISLQYSGGEIVLTGKDGATLSITPDSDGIHVNLALDIDGDGKDEMDGTSTWDEIYYAADTDHENNTVPTAQISELTSVVVGIPLVLDASNSSDADGDLLSYQWQITASPVGSVATINNPATKVTAFIPDVAGDYSVQLIVDDGYTQSQATVVQIHVASDELLTLVTTHEETSIKIGFSSHYEGLVVTGVAVYQTPDNGSLSGDYPTITYTPNKDFNGKDYITYRYQLGGAQGEEVLLEINVESVNDAPTIIGAPASNVEVGLPYVFTPTAADVDKDDSLSFTVENLPIWASFDAETGKISGIPTVQNVGLHPDIKIIVTDGDETASLPVFNIFVGTKVFIINDPEDGLGLGDVAELTVVLEGESLKFTITTHDNISDYLSATTFYIYMSGESREIITVYPDRYSVRRDMEADGLFELTVAQGPNTILSNNSIAFYIPASHFQDLPLKHIWLYSMSSRDRVPDEGSITIGLQAQDIAEVYYQEDLNGAYATGAGQTLKIYVGQDVVIFNITLPTPVPEGYVATGIRLYGGVEPKIISVNYMKQYHLYYDLNKDGLSSDMIFSGGANKVGTYELEIQVPRIYLNDIYSNIKPSAIDEYRN